jgi:hypothetical protein
MTMTLRDRLEAIQDEVELGMQCTIRIDEDEKGVFWQIKCWRRDVITSEWDWGFGGKAYPSEHATQSELLQSIFGLYKGYWEHEARENFKWKGRRIFGPHIDVEAQWEIAQRIDVRSAQHVEDRV